MKRIIAILGFLGIVVLTACDGVVHQPPPVPDADSPVYVVGDSITWQANYSGAFAGTGWEVDAVIGADLSHMRDLIEARRNNGTLGRLVIALGTNDSRPSRGGWDQNDANLWSTVIGNLHPDTQVVLVLPWIIDPADPAQQSEINEARAYMQTIAAARANTTATDWEPYTATANVMSPDGIHLLPTPEAVATGKSVPVTAEAQAARRGTIANGLGLL